MIDKTDNADNIKTTKVRVTRLDETGIEIYTCDPTTGIEIKFPRDIEVQCSGNDFSCTFVTKSKDLIYQIGDIIEITYRKC